MICLNAIKQGSSYYHNIKCNINTLVTKSTPTEGLIIGSLSHFTVGLGKIRHPFQIVGNKTTLTYAGLLGHDFLSRFNATIDYNRKILTLEIDEDNEQFNLELYLKKYQGENAISANRKIGELKSTNININQKTWLEQILDEEKENKLKIKEKVVEKEILGNKNVKKKINSFSSKNRKKDNNNILESKISNETKNTQTLNNKSILVPARAESILTIPTTIDKEALLTKREIKKGVYLGDTIVRPEHGTIKILVLNTNEEETDVPIQELNLDFEDLNEYEVVAPNFERDPIRGRIKKLQSLIDLGHCNLEEQESIRAISREFNDLFFLDGDFLTYTEMTTHKIETKANQPPIYTKPYRLPEANRKEVERQVLKMIEEDIVRPSYSPWNSPLLLVPKKPDENGNKRWRVVVDFRRINDVTIGDAYPLPNITEILDQLGKSKYFTTLDLASGFHQIRMDNRDREKTAFSTPYGHYEFNRMPFGLKGAPATFQRAMNNALSGLQGMHCFIYMDDIVVHGYDLSDHNQKLVAVFKRLREFKLKLQPEKCHFLRKEIMYLGHLITENGVKPDPSKINSVKTYPRPRKVKDIRAFLGFVGYYRRFIPRFSEIAKPLTHLLKKDVPFKFDAICEEAFSELKNKLITAPILVYPDFEKEFFVTTDASNVALGAVLSQKYEDGDHAIAYASRVLNDAETRYSTIEKELLAIVYAVEQFRPYVYGRQFTIVTDHKPLTWIMNLKNYTSRLMRWRIRLEEYDYRIIYKAGKLNSNADALSRAIPDDENVSESQNKNLLPSSINVVTRSQTQKRKGADTIHLQTRKPNNFSVEDIPQDLEETNLPLMPHKNIKHKFFILPVSPTDLERQLDFYLNLKENNVNPSTKTSIVKFRDQTIFLYKTNIPFRSSKDEKDLESILKEISKIASEKNLRSLHISIPQLAVQSSLTLKSHLRKISNHEVHLHVDLTKYIDDKEERAQILSDYHLLPTGGHQGVSRTIKRIKRRFFWDGISKDVAEFVKRCKSCQINKASKNPKIPMKISSISSKPFERVYLDVVGPLPSSYSGKRYLLTFQDDLTKFSEAIPIENVESATLAEAFVTSIVCRHGIPQSILTDQGSNLIGGMFKEVSRILKIKKLQTTPYHPQTNGALERSHRTLAEYLRSYVTKDLQGWDTWIPYAMFVYNTTPHSSTNYTPHELLYGFTVEIPHNLKNTPSVSYNYESYANELRARLQHSHELAKTYAMQSKQKSKIYYDRGAIRKTFKVGDKVLLKARTRANKFSPLWTGPHVITKINSTENSTIKIKNTEKRVHNNDLKFFRVES